LRSILLSVPLLLHVTQKRTLLPLLSSFSIASLSLSHAPQNFSPSDARPTWLIAALVRMDQVRRSDFLAFVTGRASLPPGGLAHLETSITISRASRFAVNDDGREGTAVALPHARTCTNELRLPAYADKGELEEKLDLALDWFRRNPQLALE
jgi:hypothetical protein